MKRWNSYFFKTRVEGMHGDSAFTFTVLSCQRWAFDQSDSIQESSVCFILEVPTEISPDVAEVIGLHLGDGCMVKYSQKHQWMSMVGFNRGYYRVPLLREFRETNCRVCLRCRRKVVPQGGGSHEQIRGLLQGFGAIPNDVRHSSWEEALDSLLSYNQALRFSFALRIL